MQPSESGRRGSSNRNLVAFSNSGGVPGGIETLQSQQVQLRVWVVSDLMDNLEDGTEKKPESGSVAIITIIVNNPIVGIPGR